MASFLTGEVAKTAGIIAAILFIPIAVFMYANNNNGSRVESEQDQVVDNQEPNESNESDSQDGSIESGTNTDSNASNSSGQDETDSSIDSTNNVQRFPDTSSKVDYVVGYYETKESIIRNVCGDQNLAINLASNNFSLQPGIQIKVSCN